MKNTAKWKPLNSVIYSYISEANLTTASYLRLWDLAVRGLNQINLFGMGEPKTRRLEIKENGTVDLPQDYIQWIKVGRLNGDGEVMTLKRNTDLSALATTEADRVSVNTDGEVSNIYRNYTQDDCVYNIFGRSAGTADYGNFDVDEVNGVVYLQGYTSGYIILEYLASPEATEDFMIPVQYFECLISWLRYMDIQSMPNGRRSNIGEKQLRRSEFYNSLRVAQQMNNPFRVFEANDVIRLSQKLAVKG
jgi:hypothetical protein